MLQVTEEDARKCAQQAADTAAGPEFTWHDNPLGGEPSEGDACDAVHHKPLFAASGVCVSAIVDDLPEEVRCSTHPTPAAAPAAAEVRPCLPLRPCGCT